MKSKRGNSELKALFMVVGLIMVGVGCFFWGMGVQKESMMQRIIAGNYEVYKDKRPCVIVRDSKDGSRPYNTCS